MAEHHPAHSLARVSAVTVVALLLLVATTGIAHAGLPTANPAWQWQNPAPHGDDMRSIFFLSPTHAWAVGLGRGFLHTTDAGATWSAHRVGPPLGFLDVTFSDADHGWAVGESSDSYNVTGRAVMYRSTDAGAHWSNVRVDAAPDIPLGGVAFSGTLNGWAVGRFGTVLHTADGGDTWALQDTPDEAAEYDFTEVCFTSATTGWAIGDASAMSGIVMATTDGGATWTIVDNESVPLWTGDAWGTQTAWAAGLSLTIALTTDGGATWTYGATPTPIGLESVTGIEFVDALHGVACTDSSRVLRTTDGGLNWTVTYTGDGTPFSTIGMKGTKGLALGDDGFTVATSDGGETWTELSSGSRQVIGRLSFVSAAVGWACGAAGTVLHTADSGSHWVSQTSGTSRSLYGIDFVSARRGWIVGAHGLIRRSTDGGATWRRQRSGTGAGLGGVDFLSASRGWAVGAGGVVLRTTDGGRTWDPQSSGTGAAFLDVQFIDRYRGWACGTEGIVARTTNGGRTWSCTQLRVLSWPGGTLYSVCFVSRAEGWVCGVSPAGMDTLGVVFHTTDGGRTWEMQGPTSQKTVAEMTLFGIDFTDAEHGWVVGEYGFLMWTANGGQTWQEAVRPAPDEWLLDIDMITHTVGYAAGTGGAIINTTTGGR